MTVLSTFLFPLALLAVVAVLGLGLANMVKGDNPDRAQRLMRWRVILQAAAVLLMMLVVAFNMR